jgi:hypothetical protein
MQNFRVALALFGVIFGIPSLNSAHSALGPSASDQQAIRSMSGCYEVTFQFAETFTTDPNYPVRSKPYLEHGLEWVDLDLDSPGEIHLQRILLTPQGPLKHWREEWEFEAKDLLSFKGDQTWAYGLFAPGETAGKWVQRVYQVDDSPRYECAAPWVIWSLGSQKKQYWECDAWAPLPRREFTQRNDYNVLDRKNRHEILADGFVHEQDNRKLQNGIEIAQEKGRDTYRKVDDSRCKAGADWWAENRDAWHGIQSVWRTIRTEKNSLKLASKLNGKLLFEVLFDLADLHSAMKRNGFFDSQILKKDAETLIRSYIQ